MSFLERARNALMDEDEDDSGNAMDRGIDIDDNETPVARLIRVWRDERHSPDILRFQGDLLDSLLEKLHEQASMVQHLGADPATTEEEHLRLTLVQVDMERLKFLVRSYVRVRLQKIEQFAPHIMRNPSVQAKLSVAELRHAQRYQALLASHFHTSVLDALPESTHQLDQTFGDGTTMITAPDKDHAVFIYARTECPNVRLPDGNETTLDKGSIQLLRYRTVEQLLAQGHVMLV